MLYGPNTNLVINGSILVMVECQVRYIVESLGRLLREGKRTMSCRRPVHDAYADEMQEGNARMVWGVADVPTWYRNQHGRVTQNWPFDLHTLLVPHARTRPVRLRAGLSVPPAHAPPVPPHITTPMPSQAQTDILALVPPDFADPEADVTAVRAMLAPFHGHPVPPHVRVTETELGGVRCAWYDDTRHPLADRTIFHCHGGGFVSCPLERLSLLRRAAGRAPRLEGAPGGLPPRPRTRLSGGPRRLPRRLPRPAGRRRRPRTPRGER